MNASLIGILGYVLLQLGIGYLASRKVETETDYLLAGRRLGYTMATFSIFATWFGAETCMGSAGAIYEDGLGGGRADPFGYAGCMVLMGALLARNLWRRKLVTVLDFVRERFSPGVERLGALILIPTSLMWAAAQIRALGQVLATSSSLELGLATTIAAAVVIVYTVLGGLLADVVTDIVQGVVLIVCLGVIGLLVLDDAGGAVTLLEQVPTERLRFHPPREPWIASLDTWAVPLFGSLISQELITRVNASRSAEVAVRSCYLAAGIYLLVGAVPVLLGLVGPHLIPRLEESEQLLPALAQRHLPPVLYIVFSGALVSAILSTVDSSLLSISALFSKNVLQSGTTPMNDAQKVKSARLLVVFAGILAYVIALSSESIHDLVVQASSLGGGGFLVLILFGLFTNLGKTKSALGALFLGTFVWIVGNFFVPFDGTFLAAVAGGILGYLLFAFPSSERV